MALQVVAAGRGLLWKKKDAERNSVYDAVKRQPQSGLLMGSGRV